MPGNIRRFEHPDLVRTMQQQYLAAGSKALYTFTMGANALKLGEFGLSDDAYCINKTLAELVLPISLVIMPLSAAISARPALS